MSARSEPIRRSLTRVIFICCSLVLVIATLAFLATEVLSFRKASAQQLQILGRAIASNSTAALAFENTTDAAMVLEALAADPQITAAVLYNERGQVFATWPADLSRELIPAAGGTPGYTFNGLRLHGFEPVRNNTQELGSLYVEANLSAVAAQLKWQASIALATAVLALLAAWLIARRLQQRLLEPIHALVHTASAVADRRDYSVRASRSGALEFDLFTDAFNHMLEQIQGSERRLQAQLGRLGLLQHITHAILDRQDLPSIFQVVLGSLEDNLAIDFCCLLASEDDGDTLTLSRLGAASLQHAAPLQLHEGARLDASSNGLSLCLMGRLIHEPDLGALPHAFTRRLADAGLQSMVVSPLMVGEKVTGLLLCARRGREAFTSGECEFLMQLGEHVALAGHQASLHSALQEAYDDLRQSQATILQQERLRALGEMASGIAHDINNAISPVSLYAESLLDREPNLSERTRSSLRTILQAIEDVARTVSRMREFYRDRETQLTLGEVDLNRAARQVLDLTRPRWSDQPQQRGLVIELRLQLEDELPVIMGADNEIRDALTNLVFNAVDAMPKGGVLSIATRTIEDSQGNASVVIEVGDTGIGMDEETRRRCLEPFYTTKGERGTGLGLAMVYGMIQRHSAVLEVDSTPGEGTTMRLIFAAASSLLAITGRQPRLEIPEQALRILLVDDDPLLIKSLRDILSEDGHLVTATSGGQAGIDAFRAALQEGSVPDAVITDLGMPYVDGRKVASAVKNLSPRTPVLMLTGWGQRMVAENDTPANVDRVLAKPPRLPELRAALFDLVRKAQESGE